MEILRDGKGERIEDSPMAELLAGTTVRMITVAKDLLKWFIIE